MKVLITERLNLKLKRERLVVAVKIINFMSDVEIRTTTTKTEKDTIIHSFNQTIVKSSKFQKHLPFLYWFFGTNEYDFTKYISPENCKILNIYSYSNFKKRHIKTPNNKITIVFSNFSKYLAKLFNPFFNKGLFVFMYIVL